MLGNKMLEFCPIPQFLYLLCPMNILKIEHETEVLLSSFLLSKANKRGPIVSMHPDIYHHSTLFSLV